MAESSIKHTVLVECDTSSCSGIILSTENGYILTHSSLLLPYLLEHADISSQLLKSGLLSHNECSNISSVKVSCELLTEGIMCNKISSLSASHSKEDSLKANRSIKRITGNVSLVWFTDNFKKTVSSMFLPSDKWNFLEESKDKKPDENKKSDSQISNYSIMFLPCFVLISVGDALKQFTTVAEVDNAQRSLAIGQPIFVVATPFGSLSPAVFLNSVSKGIVSNIVGLESELVLTDARCIPGTEGGALYTDFTCSSYPVGMVVAPLCWKAGEWIGLSLVCQMKCILSSLGKVFNSASYLPDSSLCLDVVHEKRHRLFENVGVVLVCSQSGSWGSGIIINWLEGLVLTCSHVVKTDQTVGVHTSVPVTQKFIADVVAATEGAKPYDLALLKLRNFKLSGQKLLVDIHPKEGNNVYILGHAAWGINHKLNASLTSGVISKIVYQGNYPVLIQTSCSVNAGASGGPLLSESGRLLGIAVCNARDMENDAWYPHVNLCVPVAVLWPAIATYLNTGDKSSLKQHFTANNTSVQKLWSLQLDNSNCSTGLASKL